MLGPECTVVDEYVDFLSAAPPSAPITPPAIPAANTFDGSRLTRRPYTPTSDRLDTRPAPQQPRPGGGGRHRARSRPQRDVVRGHQRWRP